MLSFFLGPDDFSKKEYLDKLALESGAEREIYLAEDEAPEVLHFIEQNLFLKPKLFILDGLFSRLNYSEKDWDRLIACQNRVAVVEDTLDRRVSQNKKLLSNKAVEVKEFQLPHGKELNVWILQRVKALGRQIAKPAVEALAKRLGRDDFMEMKASGKTIAVKEIFSLWQIKNEIDKLVFFAAGREISEQDVNLLVSENSEISSFEIANAIGEGKKNLALSLVDRFLLQQAAADEKISVMQLNALLAEQFRNVSMVQDFLRRRVPEKGILEKTAWKSGRLFVMKKIARQFTAEKVLTLLGKLYALDEELKTLSTPPKVLLNLILAQLF
jgi:DNA polymerase III delta subunit